MFIVLKSFASNTISATKGKIIKIKDKSIISSLVEAGYIAPYSEKEISNKEAKEEINRLTSQLADKDNEIQSLKDRIIELEEKINTESDKVTDDITDKEKELENKDNLDDNEDLTPNKEKKENGEESNEDNLDDKKSSKK